MLILKYYRFKQIETSTLMSEYQCKWLIYLCEQTKQTQGHTTVLLFRHDIDSKK